MAGDLRAGERGRRVVRRNDPGKIRVDAEQHRDAIQIEQEREDDAENGVEAEERRETEKDAERKRRCRALWCVVDVQQCVKPTPDEAAGEVNHRPLTSLGTTLSLSKGRKCG